MSRLKTIAFAASHVVFGLIGFLLATRDTGPAPRSPRATPSLSKNQPDGTRWIEKSSGLTHSLRPLKNWRGSEHVMAWNALCRAKLSTKDRIQTQRELLKSWAKVDLAAAMRAALDEAWDSDDEQHYNATGPLVDAFADAFASHPEESWDLIQNGGFGIGSSMLRQVWIQTIGTKAPLLLAALVKDLSPNDREMAVNVCASGTWYSLNKETQTKLLEQFAALPANIISSEQLADFLTMDPEEMGASALREELLHIQNPADRIAAAKAVVLGRLLAPAPTEEIAAAIADLPQPLKQDILISALDTGVSMTGEKLTSLLDLLVAENTWEKLGKRQVPGMLLASSRNGNARQIADWVTTIPFRKEATEMFYRGVETYLSDNMETSKEWIAAIPSQEWRDRAYATYSQGALNAKKDPTASRWALDHIQDPVFKSEAERWRLNWEKKRAIPSK